MTRCTATATARPTFAVDTGQRLALAARDALAELGADVCGPTDVVTAPAEARSAGSRLERDVDLHVLACATFSDAAMAMALFGASARPVLLWAFREPGEPGDRLWLNSLCGANLAAHALVDLGVRVTLLYGDPHEARVRDQLAGLLRDGVPAAPTRPHRPDGAPRDRGAAHAALDRLRGATIGLVGDPPDGFTPCRADAPALEQLLGLEVAELSLHDTFAAADAIAEPLRHAEAAAWARRSPSLLAIDPGQVGGAAAITTALGDWARAHDIAALAVRCWPEFPTEFGACPCSSLGRLHDRGMPAACERDVNGAATMLLLGALGAGPCYLMDLVEADEAGNIARFWHCGSAPLALAADPVHAVQDVHCNRRLGVAGNFPLRPGPVTVARLSRSGGEFRLLLTAGEALPAANRFQGNTADVRLDAPVGPFVHELVALGFEHHTVLAWVDLRPALRSVADLLRIPVFEW